MGERASPGDPHAPAPTASHDAVAGGRAPRGIARAGLPTGAPGSEEAGARGAPGGELTARSSARAAQCGGGPRGEETESVASSCLTMRVTDTAAAGAATSSASSGLACAGKEESQIYVLKSCLNTMRGAPCAR